MLPGNFKLEVSKLNLQVLGLNCQGSTPAYNLNILYWYQLEVTKFQLTSVLVNPSIQPPGLGSTNKYHSKPHSLNKPNKEKM